MRVVLAVMAVTVIAACSSGGNSSGSSNSSSTTGTKVGGIAAAGGPLAWPAPPADQVAPLTAAAGLQLETAESLAHHVHAHLDVFIDGAHRTVPGGLGIVITDPAVHTFG